MVVRRSFLLLALLWAAGCTSPPPSDPGPVVRGLTSTPARLAFLCVAPGCDTTKTVTVSVQGDRRVAIKRVLLSNGAEPDFSLKSSQPTPFVLGTSESFDLEVRYAPKGAPSPDNLSVQVTYTDASPDDSPDRLDPGTLQIPVVRRLVGEPWLVASPDELTFGAVEVGKSKALAVRLSNRGEGNVAAQIAGIDAGHPALAVTAPTAITLGPDAGVDLSIAYRPVVPAYLKTEVVFSPVNVDVEPARVTVEATSLPGPQVALEPETDLDFRRLPKGQPRNYVRQIVNQGGTAVTLTGVQVTDPTGNLTATVPAGAIGSAIAPLSRVPLTLAVAAKTPAEVNATVTVTSSDPSRPNLTFAAYGTVTEPKLTPTPTTLDFGTVPVGWVMVQPIELRNTGFGPLTIKNLQFISGTSGLFTFRSKPSVPAVLERDQRAAVEIEFRAETAAPFGGALSIESDDPNGAFLAVPVKATGGSCASGCPIDHGTPSCSTGVCAVASCDPGYYDTNLSASDGCECKDVGTHPGAFCADATDLGTLKDTDHVQVAFTGNLPRPGDTAVLRFFASDIFELFVQSFRVRVRLDTADPTVKLCVYRYPTGSHITECYFQNEVCPADGKFDMPSGSSNSADYIVKVYRDASLAPTCTPYTLFISNGV